MQKEKSYLEEAITFDRPYDELKARLSNEQLRMLHSVLGMSGEVGELTDAVKKSVMYDKALDIENVIEECGDIMWYMALLLDEVGSSFEEAQLHNIIKLSKRYPKGYSDKDAIERKDKIEQDEEQK